MLAGEDDIYEGAAHLRVSPDTIRRALVVTLDGRAWLAHQRLGQFIAVERSIMVSTEGPASGIPWTIFSTPLSIQGVVADT